MDLNAEILSKNDWLQLSKTRWNCILSQSVRSVMTLLKNVYILQFSEHKNISSTPKSPHSTI